MTTKRGGGGGGVRALSLRKNVLLLLLYLSYLKTEKKFLLPLSSREGLSP